MKIYFVDSTGKNLGILKKIENISGNQVLIKEKCSFRSTKSDLVILSEYDPTKTENAEMKKHSNVIVITKNKDEKTITTLAKEYDVKDVIYSDCDEEYIAERICEYI